MVSTDHDSIYRCSKSVVDALSKHDIIGGARDAKIHINTIIRTRSRPTPSSYTINELYPAARGNVDVKVVMSWSLESNLTLNKKESWRQCHSSQAEGAIRLCFHPCHLAAVQIA